MYYTIHYTMHCDNFSDRNRQSDIHTGNNLIASHLKAQWYSGSEGMHSSLYATCGLVPYSNIPSFHTQLSVCLFTAPQRLRTALGTSMHRPTDPMPYRGWHLAAHVSVHPSFFACTYGQDASLGLVSLQILFGEIASWQFCRIPSNCWLSKIRNKPSSAVQG